MHYLILLILSLLSGAKFGRADPEDNYHGINIRLYGPGGNGWKSALDWDRTFSRIESAEFPFNAVRIYATQEQDGSYKPLPMIFDALKGHNVDILLGLYLADGQGQTMAQIMDQGRFAKEFEALKEGLRYAKSIGTIDRVIGISVGNEDLYRKALTPEQIIPMIQKIQEWLKTEFPETCIPVGHTDTYHEIIDPLNSGLASTADFLAANSFPYWENKTIEAAKDQFKASIEKIDRMSQEHDMPILLGETGWPTDKQQNPNVIGSVENLQRYWKDVVCSKEFLERDAFFYIDEDYGSTPDGGPHWGILDESGKSKIDLTCSNVPGIDGLVGNQG